MKVIGLMSGTSVDGIDAALVDISGSTVDLKVELLDGATYPYPTVLREQILAVCGGAKLSIAELAELDDAIASQFAQAALSIQRGNPPAELIGSHGQTVYHRPPHQGRCSNQAAAEEPKPDVPIPATLGYSLQLGRGAAIAHLTRIPTISNFRAADIVAGGQGAPLVSAVDACLLTHPTLSRCIQNIGGIGNVTYLPAMPQLRQQPQDSDNSFPVTKERNLHPSAFDVLGWDTGPGNVLLDLAVQLLSNGTKTYDQNGVWAATGTPCRILVEQWLQQDFFAMPPPKSTGRELFGLPFLQHCRADAQRLSLSDADFLATLTDFTAAAIADNYRRFLPQLPDQVLLCGGGSKNLYLKERIQEHLQAVAVLTTNEVGLSADFKEAIAFAVLAYWRQRDIPGNLPKVTGALSVMLLGEVFNVSEFSAC